MVDSDEYGNNRLPLVFDTPKWLYSRRNSDWRMKLELAKGLKQFCPEIQSGLLYTVLYNARFILPRFFPRRWGVPIQKWLARQIGRIMSRKDPFVFLTQSLIPPIPRGAKIIWETYFLPPQDKDAAKEFRRGGRNVWIQALEEFGPQVAKIAVRGEYSVNLLRKMYPEFAEKVVNLSFVHDEYYIASPAEVEIKQMDSGPLNITFVGREARRKGLPELLYAIKTLRYDIGIGNFVLNVVSNFNDGTVELPKEDWINYHAELPHDDVLRLLRRTHVFVMPSRFESYGLVYLEAMAAGCVVVARDGEPQREFLDYGRAGYNVACSDVCRLSQILEKIIRDSDLRSTIAKAALNRYRFMYSQECVRREWAEVIGALTRNA